MKPRKQPKLLSYRGVRRVVHGAGRRCTPGYLDALNRHALHVVLQHVAVHAAKTLDADAVAAPVLSGLDMVRQCSVCGCTDDDCSGCVKRTGLPCHWVAEDLCSACAETVESNR